VLVGDEYAHESCLGIGCNAARSEVTDAAPLDALVALASVELPNVRGFSATLRDPVLASVKRWGAVLWAGGQRLTAPVREIAVLDRVGGGDGFVSGLPWTFINR
jgi:2-dehydro-3-deoxygluconokinase